MVMKFEEKRTFLKLALTQQLALLFPCKCLFHVISVGVFFEGTWNSWVNSASCLPALGPSDSHYSRAPLYLLLSGKQARDWGTDLRLGLTFALPPVILLWFQEGMEFSEEPKASAGLG